MNVVIRLPWPRPPKEEHNWTPEKDNILWTFLAMYRSSDMNWDVISNRLGMPTDECVKRAGYLYQQQLHNLQQKRSSTSSLTRQSSQESLRNESRPSPLSQSPSQGSSFPQSQAHQPSSSTSNDKVDPDHLRDCVRRYDFDWLSIGRELGMNPMQCRKLYMELESTPVQSPNLGTSPQPIHHPQTLPYDIITPQTSHLNPAPNFSNFSSPAFLPDDSKPTSSVSSVISSLNSNSSGSVGSMKLGDSDMSDDDYNANSSSGELFSDSLSHSTLGSGAYFSSSSKNLE